MIYKLTEICKIIGGGTPKTSISEYWNGNIFWISVKDFAGEGRYVYHTEKKITEKGLKNSSTKLLEKDDIIISARGTVGEIAMIPYPMAFNQSCFGLRGNKLVDKNYLYYFLKTQIKNLKKKSNGAVFDTITTSTFSTITCELPTLIIQSEIAGILSSLDAKIETNNKLNEKLEEMAQAIFKSWFVDFEPFKDKPFHETELGMIPEGWEVTTIGEQFKTLLGGTPSRNKEEYWNGNIAWINSGEINNFRILNASEYITEEGLKNSATKLLPCKTTVLAITGATLGQVSLLEIDTCANQSVIGVLESDVIKYQFIYPLINTKIKYLILHQTGGAQQHINKQNVDGMKFVMPPRCILMKYQKITQDIFNKISTLSFENDRLASLRDTLLPRLMSGELKV